MDVRMCPVEANSQADNMNLCNENTKKIKLQDTEL